MTAQDMAARDTVPRPAGEAAARGLAGKLIALPETGSAPDGLFAPDVFLRPHRAAVAAAGDPARRAGP